MAALKGNHSTCLCANAFVQRNSSIVIIVIYEANLSCTYKGISFLNM